MDSGEQMPTIPKYPKGGMCLTCIRRDEDCSKLKFSEMPVIQIVDDTMAIVRCTKWSRGRK